jgi:hypothetical protein
MKTALLSLALIFGLSTTTFLLQSNTVSFAKYNPKCNFEDEEPSNITKIVKFPQYGIQMEIPKNVRTMLRNDGTVEIIGNSTYRSFQCPEKDRIGKGYLGYKIYRGSKQYNKTVPLNKKGLYVVIKEYKDNGDDTVYYEMAIRVQTSVGLVDISMIEGRKGYRESELEEATKEYSELANTISLLE